MRPWVLVHENATVAVPHICNLDVVPALEPASTHPRVRLRGKHPDPVLKQRSHAKAWSWYVRGHIVSRHAQRLLVQFMAACCKKSQKMDDLEENDEKEDEIRALPPGSKLPLIRLHAILDRMSEEKPKNKKGDEKDTNGEEDALPTEPEHGKSIQTAVKLTAQLWNRSAHEWPPDVDDDLNSMVLSVPKQSNNQKTNSKKNRLLQPKAYIKLTHEACQRWLDGLSKREKPPNKEQRAFLETVVQRCRKESE